MTIDNMLEFSANRAETVPEWLGVISGTVSSQEIDDTGAPILR